jgi:aryl-alcohol dehydrogenase-like predicted oxidoreductase
VRYRPLGRTGLSVSVIGLGTWQLGGEWGIDFTQAAVDEILDAAAECGINLIDTAECYGDHLSEALIGDYLARHDRSRWIVATKFGHRFDGFLKRQDDFSVDGVRKQLDASLQALRIETIDLYQFHSGPDTAFDNDDLWTMLHGQRDAGKIRHLGVSLNKTTERQADWAAQRGVEVIQVVHNRLDQRAAGVHFPFAARDGLGVLARVPLASGLLSGKYQVGAQFPANDVRSRAAPGTMQQELEEVARIRRDEVPSGVPMAQWAIAWCVKNPLVSAVIPGCKNAGQVRDNAAAADLVLLD